MVFVLLVVLSSLNRHDSLVTTLTLYSARSRARYLSQPVAPAYASLQGMYGLATDDVWNVLLSESSLPGLRFTTRTVVQASMGPPTDWPDMKLGVPIHRLCSVQCDLHKGPIVRFVSASPHSGCFRSLIQTSVTGCCLPPLATITLEKILEPGTWDVNGVICWNKCFVVTVAFAL